MPTLSDIHIVTVAYNSTAIIPQMLASVPEGVSVTIVDNASTDIEALRQCAAEHGAQIIPNQTNAGFGAACNQGAAGVVRPWLMFLNPDAALAPGCLEALCAATDAHPDAAGFVPQVRDGRGRPAFRRRSRLLPRRAWWQGPPPDAPAQVPLLNGAAIFVSAALFRSVGGFDDAIFLYHEDDDLSLRLRAHGPLRYVPGAVVHHAEGRSTQRSPASAAFKAYHMGQSAVYAMAKHGRPMAALRVRLFALGQMISPLSLLSRRKRAKALGFLRGAFAPLRRGGAGVI